MIKDGRHAVSGRHLLALLTGTIKVAPVPTENNYCHYMRFCYFHFSFANRLNGQPARENGLNFHARVSVERP
jgi:hypothetical protein